jgi:hypothetical protein
VLGLEVSRLAITAELRRQGWTVNHKRVRRLLRKTLPLGCSESDTFRNRPKLHWRAGHRIQR